jgi:hypothetical protein
MILPLLRKKNKEEREEVHETIEKSKIFSSKYHEHILDDYVRICRRQISGAFLIKAHE